MKKIHKDRLLKLALHLEKGKLGHKKFNFAVYNGGKDGLQLEENGCGYAGCAIGECPFVFPGQWTFRAGWPRLTRGSFDYTSGDGAEFFGLVSFEFSHLFKPGSQFPPSYGGKVLQRNATRKQVAKGIRAFIAHKEKEASL